MLVLTVLQGPDQGRRFELPDDEPQLIGRSSEALDMTDHTISRRHAELTPNDGKWMLHDLQSANGTFVNGVRVNESRLLQPGDQVRAGSSLLLYGEQNQPQTPLRYADKKEMEVSIEDSVASSDDSMIMSVPDPSQAAQFHLKVIYDLTSVISTVTDKQSLFERVMDVIFEYFKADRGFILLREDPENDKQMPEPFVVRRRDQAFGEMISESPTGNIPISRTIIQYVMRRNQGVLTSNAMKDKRFARGDSVQALRIHSALCAPIKFKNRLYGVIHLDSQVVNYTYTEDQLALLTAIGVQSGMALSNLRLVDQRLRAERLAAVGQTVASLSHSIKNILQGMQGGGDVVEIGLRKKDLNLIGSGWTIVDRNQKRIYDLAKNMLAFSKQRQPEREMTNLESFLHEISELVQGQFDQKHVALIMDVAEDLPPIPIDPGGMHQTVVNLLNNALDAVEPQSGVVTLSCHYDENNEHLHLTVTDNGEGMNAQTQRKLFEPFHSTKGYGGTGLGLVVSKKTADEHGGTIHVESTVGQGTTFTLTIPADTDQDDASSDTHGPAKTHTAQPANEEMTS